ncbi:hypothetical protein NPX13_g302 [Xylaria arbuscula]|uniref:NACHT domain-containing protein n=1 Tax=Xylaria arbuscula TaxID=114810 RepID=A0A9W8TS53_9PEZI|nr:hypothetical protein NPX13_g302 [Xylaria arbuscula]
MDPITAVALAGNVLQFIQFVAGLLDGARKLHASTTGTSSVNDHFQDICSTLINYNAKLQKSPVPYTGQPGKLSKHDEPLTECTAACARDCEDLLRIMRELRAIASKRTRYWSSFRAALAEIWKQKEIEDLQSRIADRHRQMTLLLCATANESILTLDTRIKDIGRGIWNLETDSRLDEILKEIKKLKDRVEERNENETASADYISGICAGFSNLSLETQIFEKEARILATLNYNDRTARHEKIPDAHFTTFKWSLRETGETKEKYGRLRRWLAADDALFWVSGKPGSGKSTFMKSVADSEQTIKCLKAWAGRHDLLIVSHYFTIYGTPIQRSLEGLLRSLAFGILSLKPRLIPKLLINRWERTGDQPRWTQSELGVLLRLLGTETGNLTTKICYFIDGLDEFEGDHLDICQTLKQLCQSHFIKMCVSSRPWNVFEDSLGDSPSSKLYMHELTRGDIRYYTESRLNEHPRWKVLQEEADRTPLRSLINDVVAKSNGVFLWVTLVVRLLREGLTNDDSLFDLQNRLSSLPTDLEDFFRHIIRTVDPFYTKKMAGSLSPALEAREPLCLEIFSFHDREYDHSENYAFENPTDLMNTDPSTISKLYATVSRRINGRCKGLLERNGDRMEFLHRTVYDFLRTDEMSEFLRSKLETSHNPSLSILKAFIAWIKRSKFSCTKAEDSGMDDAPMSEINSFVVRLRQALQYAHLAEAQGGSSKVLTAALLDHIEHSITHMLSRGQIEMTNPSFARDIFRQLVLEAGVVGYIRNKLIANPRFFMCQYAVQFRSPLYSILSLSWKRAAEDQYWILNQLLKNGHSPNRLLASPRSQRNSWTPWNPWKYLLVQLLSGDEPHWIDRLLACVESKVPLILLNHGADPTIVLRVLDRWISIFGILLYAIARVYLCETPHAYEETIATMLKSPQLLQYIRTDRFWKENEVHARLRPETKLNNEEFLVRIFAQVLSKIPVYLEAFKTAEAWMMPVLSPEGYDKLVAAVVSASTKKRQGEEGQEKSTAKKKRRKATTPRRTPKYETERVESPLP